MPYQLIWLEVLMNMQSLLPAAWPWFDVCGSNALPIWRIFDSVARLASSVLSSLIILITVITDSYWILAKCRALFKALYMPCLIQSSHYIVEMGIFIIPVWRRGRWGPQRYKQLLRSPRQYDSQIGALYDCATLRSREETQTPHSCRLRKAVGELGWDRGLWVAACVS